jgi:hypothetical protein
VKIIKSSNFIKLSDRIDHPPVYPFVSNGPGETLFDNNGDTEKDIEDLWKKKKKKKKVPMQTIYQTGLKVPVVENPKGLIHR